MAASDAAELQELLFQTLTTSAELNAHSVGGKIYDEVPDRMKPPYIALGRLTSKDWSTFTEGGTEHFLELEIWSSHQGKKEIHEIAVIIEGLLDGLSGNFPNHQLISIRRQSLQTDRIAGSDLRRGILQIRAVTEPSAN